MSEDSTVARLIREEGRPLTADEIADRLGLSMRSVRRRLRRLEESGAVTSETKDRTKFYALAPAFEAVDQNLMLNAQRGLPPLTKVEEIVHRLRKMEEVIDQSTLKNIKEYVLSTNAKELKSELEDFLEDKVLQLKTKDDEESKRKRDWFKEDLNIVKSMVLVGNVYRLSEEYPQISSKPFVVSGTDASSDFLELLWRIGLIPIQLKLLVTSSSAVVGKFDQGFEEPKYEYLDEPRFPISAGEMYVEELSTRYPNLDESEKHILSMISMNATHFKFDNEVILHFQPITHFHDGRLLPPHMSYLDFYHKHRRDALWSCFNESLNVKNTAYRMKCNLVGVVKETHSETAWMRNAINMLLEKQGKASYGEVHVGEMEVMDFLLEPGQVSWVIQTKPKDTYIPSEEEKKAQKILGEQDFERYKTHLEEAEYCFFYAKHAEHGLARYDFFKPTNPDEILSRQNTIAPLAHRLAVPLVGEQLHLMRKIVYVPNVLSFADVRAKAWAKSVTTYLFQYLRSKLLR